MLINLMSNITMEQWTIESQNAFYSIFRYRL